MKIQQRLSEIFQTQIKENSPKFPLSLSRSDEDKSSDLPSSALQVCRQIICILK